jgi:DNA-directed RNA polymerase subunit F
MSGTSDSLLRLIATMSKQERRYFKLHTTFYNKEEGNSCLRLFQLIEKNRPNNNTELVALVEREAYTQQLSFLKNQLTEQILNSLSAYHASKKSWHTLQQLLSHIDILIDRGLHDHARRLIVRAEKKALRLQEDIWMMEVLHRKRAVAIRNVTPDFEQDIHRLYDELRAALTRFSSTTQYRELMDIMQVLAARYAATPTKRDGEKLRAIIGNSLLGKDAQPGSFHAQLALHNMLGTYALLTGNSADARKNYHEAIQLWKHHPVMAEEYPLQYRNYLLNYLNCLVDSNEEAEFTAILRELKKLFSTGQNEPAQREELWNLELLFYMNRGNLLRCREVIQEMEHELSTQAELIAPPVFITLCYNCGIYYFLKGSYAKALDYMYAIQNETRTEIKRDLQVFSRLLSLVIHYELGNADILDNMIRATRRYLKNNDAANTLTRILTSELRALTGCIHQREQQDIYRTLRTELGTLLHAGKGQEIVGLPELLFWTESKLYGRAIGDVFAEKMKAGSAPQEIFPVEATGK